MAAWIGGLFGLAWLIFTWSIYLKNWSGLGLHLKVFLLAVPTIFGTIGVLAILYALHHLATKWLRRLTGRQEPDSSIHLTPEGSASGNLFVILVMASVGMGLYATCELLFG